METITYTPIGFFHCANHQPYGAPRQGVLAKESEGIIKLQKPITRDCISDLEGFDRIWLVYSFHQNQAWKPKVQPPRGSSSKRSVLATRSPYRPNSLGMSCVKLERIDGLKIYVSEHDLLDQSPILDIKPYITYADSFPEASLGWIDDQKKYEVSYREEALEKVKWLDEKMPLDLFDVIRSQLEFEPTCRKAKRVKKTEEGYLYSLQVWRLPFELNGNSLTIKDIYSGYSKEELNDPVDPYNDKELHKEFRRLFL